MNPRSGLGGWASWASFCFDAAQSLALAAFFAGCPRMPGTSAILMLFAVVVLRVWFLDDQQAKDSRKIDLHRAILAGQFREIHLTSPQKALNAGSAAYVIFPK